MIEEFIDSVLIIDDNEDEIKGLKETLAERDIWVTFLNPPKEKREISAISKPYRNRKLIFLDLRIDEKKKTIDNISVIIRPLLERIISTDFGSYGIVMWTKHESHISEFKEKIQKDSSFYQLPLFVLQMDKSKYLREGFDSILNDLEEILRSNIAAKFFISWSNLIQKGKDSTITSIFELIPDYKKQESNLEFLLFKMAQNYTGIHFDNIDENYPLSIDAIKAFNDLLVSKINLLSQSVKFIGEKNKVSFHTDDGNIVFPKTEIAKISKELLNLFSELNSHLLMDDTNIHQNKIIPGNVYEIKDTTSKLKHPNLPENAIPLIIEMTPPCDFSTKKTVYPRVLSGYMIDLNFKKLPNGEKFYRELWPLKFKEKENPQVIVFDFRILGFISESDLQDESKYKLMFRVKDKLFADILQKMSAHTARLGLSIVR